MFRRIFCYELYFLFFDSNFKRFNEDITNFALNYAYQIIRAKISQEIVSSGFNPCLGINHTSEYNSFNLADDFIEVYRPIVDYFVSKILEETLSNTLTPSIKEQLLDIINKPVRYNNQNMKLYLSIPLYIQNMFNFLTTGDINKIIFDTNSLEGIIIDSFQSINIVGLLGVKIKK